MLSRALFELVTRLRMSMDMYVKDGRNVITSVVYTYYMIDLLVFNSDTFTNLLLNRNEITVFDGQKCYCTATSIKRYFNMYLIICLVFY
jgi:hypothetical protein